MQVRVDSEYGKLLTVYLVRPTYLLHHQPEVCPLSWRALPDPERLLAQWDAFRDLLISLGVRVLWADATDSTRYDAVFTRDVGVVIGETLVLGRPEALHRQHEDQYLLSTASIDRTCRVVQGMTLEGADVLRFENRLYVGIGRRTSRSVISLLQAVAGVDVLVIPANRRGPGIPQHLLGGHMPAGKLLLVRDDVESLPCLAQSERVEVHADAEVVSDLGLNMLTLDATTVLMTDSCPGIRALLERRGVRAITSPMDELAKLGGGFACASLPLERV